MIGLVTFIFNKANRRTMNNEHNFKNEMQLLYLEYRDGQDSIAKSVENIRSPNQTSFYYMENRHSTKGTHNRKPTLSKTKLK